MARRATVVKQTRQASQNVLLLDAGNALYATTGPNVDAKGQYMIEAMNRLGYDAMLLGDMDFTLGIDVLKQRIAEAKFPVLSANVYVGGTEKLLAEPYVLRQFGGQTVAIIGITSRALSATAPTSGSEPLVVSDPVESLKKVMGGLKGKADIFIVLSNLGFSEDNALAAQVPGISVIVGGRSSTLLQEPWKDPTNGTIVVQAGFQGEWMGQVTASFNANGKMTSYKGTTLLLTRDYADDPDVRAWLDTLPK
jgi:5'-nucleotidase